jgi:drug/metabolite transporter (DMT)-like permease
MRHTIAVTPMFSSIFTRISAPLGTQPQLAAMFYILISTTAFSAMNVAIHALAGEFHPAVIVCLRTLVTLVLLAPFLAYAGPRILETSRWRLHLLRGIVGGIGMIGWVYSVTLLPVSYATALSFTAPLFVTVLAVLFLHERAGIDRFAALIVGFIGTLIILRPGAESFDWRSLVVLATTVLWAVTGILVKQLSASEPPLRMVTYMNVVMFFVALPFAWAHWHWPNLHGWGILTIIAACSLIMHTSMVRAYKLAPISALMPFDFTRLISTAILAYLLFGETIDLMTWIGAAIIVASAAFMARRDARAAMVE